MNKTFQYLASEIFYTISGAGQAVVLLHGFAEDHTIWSQQATCLEQQCRLIIPDLPGSGQSEMLPGQEVTIMNYADCINALLGHENIDNCIILGHSLGGYITLAFAEKYPGRLKAFGLVHSTAFADNEEKKSARKKGIILMEEYGVQPFLKNTTPNLFSKVFKEQHPERVAALIKAGNQFTKEALIQYYTAMMNRSDRTRVLIKSEVPVLFIIGSEDVAAPLQDLLEQVHLPKISYIHIIEGVGHMSLWEAPDELNNHLAAFVKEVGER